MGLSSLGRLQLKKIKLSRQLRLPELLMFMAIYDTERQVEDAFFVGRISTATADIAKVT